MIIALYRVISFMLWFGIAFAVCTIVVAVALVLVVGAVLMGALTPGRTASGQLRSLVLNTRQAVIEVKVLDPRRRRFDP